MPRSRSIRVEIYLPVRFDPSYQQTRAWLVRELTAFFGGCSVIDQIEGWYRAKDGSTIEDAITLIYSDTPKLQAQDERVLQDYLDELNRFTESYLSEESIFIAYWPVTHAYGS